MKGHELRQELLTLLSEGSSIPARSLAGLLRRRGLEVDRSQVNSILYSFSDFSSDGSVPPRWSLAASAPRELPRVEHRVSGLGVENWKIFDAAALDVAPITLLFGENSSGKSSLIQALLLMQQSWGTSEFAYEIGGGSSFAFHQRVVHRHELDRTLTLTAHWGAWRVSLMASKDERWAFGPAQPIQLITCATGESSIALFPNYTNPTGRPSTWSIARRTGADNKNSAVPLWQTVVESNEAGFPNLRDAQRRAMDQEDKRILSEISDVVGKAGELFAGLTHIGPFRRVPDRDLTLGQARREAPYVARLYESEALREDVDLWLSKFDIPYELEVDHYGGDGDDAAFGLALRHSGGGERVELPDVGFGVSQLLPLVVQLIASRERTILIEEPEAHVHPRLQSILADLFIESAQEYGNVLVVETHSEPVLLRLQRRIAEQRLDPSDLSVTHVRRSHFASTLDKVGVDDDGQLDYQWPGGFFDNRMDDLVALLEPRIGG
ncbi:AAA family ATPase [Aquipuribacter sp. MA13-6]|uniref:AAA family ATPase n=1 Tax=unclassified Aquipuribacter TaxID=2635084 RepID=UPI003EEF4754